MEWFEDDRFWAGIEGLIFDKQRKEEAGADAENVVRLLALEPGAAVLDLCCGPGRHSVALAKLGFRVTGVDRTAQYLAKAKTFAAEQGVEVEWIHADMREFQRKAAFDGAVNLYTSFGYFEDPAEDLKVLANLRASLRPGARLVMDMAGKEIIARIFTPRDWQESDEGALVLMDRSMTPGWKRMKMRWISIRGSERSEFCFDHRMFSAAELERLLLDAGFRDVDIHGALDGRPYDQSAQRLVAVARS